METLLSEEAVTAAIGSVYEGRSLKRVRPDELPEGPHQAARRGARNHKCGPTALLPVLVICDYIFLFLLCPCMETSHSAWVDSRYYLAQTTDRKG